MRLFVLGFLAGTLALQQAAGLPDGWPLLAGAALLLAVRLARHRAARLVLLAAAGALLGFGHAAWRAQARLAEALPPAWEGRDVALAGVVAALPQARERSTRFLFEVRDAGGAPVPRRILLDWYFRGSGAGLAPPALEAGQRWRLVARLKAPRGLANPHAFDFEPWALERGIRATGYVRSAAPVTGVDAGMAHALHRWRGRIRESMLARLGPARLRGVLVALAIGDQGAIAAADWRTFWRTGVGHLMSISGLHITMLGGLGFALAHRAWARIPALALRLPARKAAVVAGALVAFAYSLMTGFAVPAQRTFAMLAAIALCVLLDRHGSATRVLAAAAFAVMALDPWAVLAPGFWLSFGAVAAIFYVTALRPGRTGMAYAAAREQVAVTLAMAPMLLALFGEASLASPLANALAIPVVGLAVVPLTLAGAFLGAPFVLEAAHALMLALMAALEALAAWPGALQESHAPAPWTVAAALAGCAWVLAPRGVPLRGAGVLWMVPMFAVLPARPPPGAAWIDVLDTGNGLAVVVRTARHALAYDAGPSWDGEADTGSRIVVPFLRGEGIARLDGLVVSHADDDHAGGARSVAVARAPSWLLSSLAAGDPLHAAVPRSIGCVAGRRWAWDGVRFSVLHPGAGDAPRRENDRSCVLRVQARGGVALLTGDIEARSEARLLERARGELRADVLLVPHHGSRTSSTAPFLDAVAPSVAVASVGYRNRFGHPHPAVVARYAARGIRFHRTDRSGAIRIVLPEHAAQAAQVGAHPRPVRYWSIRRPP